MTSARQDPPAREAAADYPREPLPLARSILWYPAGRGSRDTGARSGYPVFVDQSVLNAIGEHVGSAPDTALMGFLAGELYVCSDIEVPYLVVDGVFVCRYPIENDDPMSLVQRVWDRLQAEVTRQQTRLVGWYRSHPTGDVFMSPTDVTLHEARFPESWHVAVMVRPDRKRPAGGIYRRVPGHHWASSPVSFYELLAAAPRRSTAGKRTQLSWTNYHTNEVVLSTDERGQRPEDEASRVTVPTPRPNLEVVRPSTPARTTPVTPRRAIREPAAEAAPPVEAPPPPVAAAAPPVAPPAPTAPPDAPARQLLLDLPLPDTPAPRPAPPSRPPAEGPPLVRATSGRARRRRRWATMAAITGVAAAAVLGTLLAFQAWRPSPADPTHDLRAARLHRLDRVSDTLGPALRNFGERSLLYHDGLLGCAGLARGYAAVDTLWRTYRATRGGLGGSLDAARQVRDERLATQVDDMRHEFARAGCTAP